MDIQLSLRPDTIAAAITSTATTATTTTTTAPLSKAGAALPEPTAGAQKPQQLESLQQNPPAVQVSIRQEPVPSPVYTEPLANVNRLRDDSHAGAAARATSQVLLSSLNQMTDSKAPFSVAGIFSQISSLSKETTEYRNEARQFKVPQKLLTEKFSPDFAAASGNKAEAVTLRVKTKDGDTIQIQVSRINYKDGSTGLDFSFVVDGSLSEAEQKALGQLSDKLAQTSDAFFRNGTTELHGLQDLDTSVISGFNLSLQRPKGDTVETHTYDFKVDEVAQTQTLSAEDVNGYKVEISSGLDSLSKGQANSTHALQQYIDLIRQATDESDAPSESQRFMLDAFSSFFSALDSGLANDLTTAADSSGAAAAEKNIAAFDSGLPDFTAKFSSPVFHNPNFYSQASAMVLNLAQVTSMETEQDNVLIKQESRYSLTNNRFAALPGLEFADTDGGNYRYITQRTEATTSRILSMVGDEVNGLWLEQDVVDKKNVSVFENYRLTDESASNYDNRNVQNFIELLENYSLNKKSSAIGDLLTANKEWQFLSAL